MPPINFLHRHRQFSDLLRIVASKMSIAPALVEKDYWIMHCLHGLQTLELAFELKGGTSLSKGYGIIHRFSEDIDIRIEPPASMDVKTGKNHEKAKHCQGRRRFYDWLAETIRIDGIDKVERDTAFDDKKFRSGGIRLHYKSTLDSAPLFVLKHGILLEVGFDDVTPNHPKDISSWAYDYAVRKIPIIDNSAKAVLCYDPGYTLVEKLQTISTKYRQQQDSGSPPESVPNFLRHYFDVYCLLQEPAVLSFIGTSDYQTHKDKRFRSGDEPIIAKNEAFVLSDGATRAAYEKAYQITRSLYYKEKLDFTVILNRIQTLADKL
jgi:hypothetical protein